MRADDQRDKKFITLLRQTHTLPFSLLPCTKKKCSPNLNHPGLVYAVFQPIDHINPQVLDQLAQSHRDLCAWKISERDSNYASTQGAPGQVASKDLSPNLQGRWPNDAMAQLPESKVWTALLCF